MKKIIKLVLFVMLAMMLAAFAGGSGNGGGSAAKTIADDDVMALHMNKPAEFVSVERYCEATTDGKIVEKDLVYNLSDEESITIGFMPAQKLSDMTNVDNLEQYEINGFTVYRFNNGNDVMGFIQNGEDLYVVDMTMKEVDDGTKLKELLGGVSFTSNTTTVMDEPAFDELNYQLDDDHSVYKTTSRVTEDPNGNLMEKNVGWHYGEEGNEDFTFMIRVDKNKTFADILIADNTYEDVEINGLAYKVYVSSANEKPYSYYIEHDNDVYNIRNSGDTSGWFSSRSEESYTCFDKFINSISFK